MLLCVMASLIPFRMILPGATNHLRAPRNTTKSDLLGWESRPALQPAPVGSPKPTILLISAATWTALPTPPKWALDGSLVAAPSLSRVNRLVALAEANAQRKHDEAFGPSQGAALDSALHGDTKAESVLDLRTMD